VVGEQIKWDERSQCRVNNERQNQSSCES
jgi:hypothetical protein